MELVKLGITKLFLSSKATLCLLILLCATIADLLGKMDGMSYAATISTIAVIYNYCQHRVDIQQSINSSSLIQSGAQIITEMKGKL